MTLRRHAFISGLRVGLRTTQGTATAVRVGTGFGLALGVIVYLCLAVG